MQNVKLLILSIGAFVIFNFTFYIQPVRAQACAPGSFPDSGNTCQGTGGREGRFDDCGVCTNLSCPQTPVAQQFCNDTCTPINTIPTGQCTIVNPNDGTRDSCGRCVANGPRAATRQYGSYPGVAEEGFIHVSGDIGSGGDMYLNSGRAIRVDGDTATNLNVGNYSGAAGAGDTFGLRLHAPDTAIAELLLEQGTSDRWSISLRTPSRNFEIWRNNAGWSNALTINYGTGAVSINGALTVGGEAVLTNVTAPAGSGIAVTGNGNTRQIAVSGCVAGQVLKRAADGATWECAEDAQGAPGVTDHGLLDDASLRDNDHTQYYLQSGDTRALTVGGNLNANDSIFAYRIFPGAGTNSFQLGRSSDIVSVGGLLGVGTFRDESVIGPTPGIGQLFYRTSSVGAPAGLQVYNGTAWTAVSTPATNYTAGDYVTIGADNRISATHDGGCFGPTFAGVAGSTSGQITSGGLAGYRAAHKICADAFPASGTTLAGHMCGTQEILNSVSCGTSTGTSLVFRSLPDAVRGGPGRAWIANGAPALPTQTNDCNGWTFGEASATVNGVAWQLNENGGVGWAQTCDSTFPIACCR